MTMTAEQLEELLRLAESHDAGWYSAQTDLTLLAPHLARRVIAAERLAAEVERVSFSDNAIAMIAALIAYRKSRGL